MSIELKVFLIVQLFFLIGLIPFLRVNRRKTKKDKSRWSKYFTYMMVVNFVTYSINRDQLLFKFICLMILIQGLLEIYRALRGKGNSLYFNALVLAVYSVLVWGFWDFTSLDSGLIIWTYLAIFLFDGFSQLSGQLFGKHPLAPDISPNKTIEGTIGGALITLVSVYFLAHLASLSALESIIGGVAICLFALLGDLLASWLKRKCYIKDFGKILPGHGGILDRFDSFIFSGAMVNLCLIVIS